MPKFYVKNKEDKWNIYSSVVDDLYFNDFMSFDELKKYVCSDAYNKKAKEMDTLLTDKKELNYMEYDECLEKIKFYNHERYEEMIKGAD